MVKKSIIAIALMGMLATVSYGQGDPVWGGGSGQIKVDGLWPGTIGAFTYTPQEICRIKVYIKVGMFIEIENCSTKKIVMSQVTCTVPGQTFPCYKGCVEIKVRANFEAKLSLKLYKTSTIIYPDPTKGQSGSDKWRAYFTADGGVTTPSTYIVTGDGNFNVVQVCVEAWDANIFNAGPGTEQQVGEVAILAVPTATPDLCDYLNCN